MDSTEWHKNQFSFSDSYSERRPLLTSSGGHLLRPFDPNGEEFRYCKIHIRLYAQCALACELVGILMTLLFCSIFFGNRISSIQAHDPIQIEASQNKDDQRLLSPVGGFEFAVLLFCIGLPCVCLAFFGIRREKYKFLIPHQLAQIALIIVLIVLMIVSITKATYFTNLAHASANEGDHNKANENYKMMTYHSGLAVFIAFVIALEILFGLIVRKCFTYLKIKRMLEEGRLIPAQVKAMKKTLITDDETLLI